MSDNDNISISTSTNINFLFHTDLHKGIIPLYLTVSTVHILLFLDRKRGQDDVGYEGPSAKRANVSISPLDSSSSSPSPPPPPPLSEFAIPMPPPQILPIVDELFSSSDTECVPAEKFTAAIEAKRPKMKAQQELQVKPDIAEKEAKEPVHAGERSGTQALPSHLRFYDIFQRKDRQNSE